ncbi:MAG: PAS domain S-box protein [Isosphaeraceae bacterium]
MSPDTDEDEKLSPEAQRNAQAVLPAREGTARELAAERERLRITLASIGDAVISTGADGRVTYLNRVAEALTGWPLAEAAGRPLSEVFRVIDEQSRAEAESPVTRALRGASAAGAGDRKALVGRDGVERSIEASASPIRDESGEPTGVVLVFRDTTERRRAQEAQARLAAIVESSDDAIVSKTLDGVILSWNAGAERLFGYTAAEAVGRPITMIIPPDRLDEEHRILSMIRRGERVEPFESQRIARDGRVVEVSLSVSPVRDASGRVVAASKVARDISERRRAEEALRASEHRHRFLSDLAAETQSTADPEQVLAVTARRLAEQVGADRCLYGEVEDESIFVVMGDHTRGVPSMAGRWALGTFGPEVTRLLVSNQVFVSEDVEADPRIDGFAPAYRAREIRAVVCVPLCRDSRFSAAVAVHQKTPRRWTPEEIDLVRTVAWRCWEALERARVTRNLRESESRYRAMVEATPECVKLIGADGRLLQLNPAGVTMLGARGADEVVGASYYEIVAPEHRTAFRAFNERVCRGETGSLEFDVVGLHGGRRHLETTAVPLPAAEGGFTHLAVTRDTTDRVEAARALADSRARLDYAVRLSGVGFWYCDLPLSELCWDKRVKEHFWLPPDARVTLDLFFERIHPDDREPTRKAIETSILETPCTTSCTGPSTRRAR